MDVEGGQTWEGKGSCLADLTVFLLRIWQGVQMGLKEHPTSLLQASLQLLEFLKHFSVLRSAQWPPK